MFIGKQFWNNCDKGCKSRRNGEAKQNVISQST